MSILTSPTTLYLRTMQLDPLDSKSISYPLTHREVQWQFATGFNVGQKLCISEDAPMPNCDIRGVNMTGLEVGEGTVFSGVPLASIKIRVPALGEDRGAVIDLAVTSSPYMANGSQIPNLLMNEEDMGTLFIAPRVAVPSDVNCPFRNSFLPAAWIHRGSHRFGVVESFGVYMLPFHRLRPQEEESRLSVEDHARIYGTVADEISLRGLLADYYTVLGGVVSVALDPTNPDVNQDLTMPTFRDHAIHVHKALTARDFAKRWGR